MKTKGFIQLALVGTLIITGCDDSARRSSGKNQPPDADDSGGVLLESKVKPPQDNAVPTSKGTSPELVELGESVVSLRKNGDVHGAVLAMARLMQGWSPVGLSRQEAIKMLGEPDQMQPSGMVYRLDTGTGGCQWEFEIRNNVISKVTKRLME